MRHRLPVGRSIGLLRPALLALLALAPACSSSDGAEETPPETAGAESADAQPGEPTTVDLARMGMDTGDSDAALAAVVEFADFGCIHCATFHTESYAAIEEEFVDSGEIYWKYVPITLGGFPNGQLAGIAAVCAENAGIFAAMRDRLFSQRNDWMTREEDDAHDAFVAWAGDLGADPGDFEDCLESEEADAEIERNNQAARQIGVRVTPSFVIQGQVFEGSPPLDQFREALGGLLDEIRAAEEGEEP